MKKLLALVLASAIALSLVACGSKEAPAASAPSDHSASAPSEAPKEKIIFKMGHVNGVESAQQICGEKMNELLAERLPQYELEIHPSGQLGGERDMSEAIQMGSLDMLSTATTPLANFVPEIEPLEILYLLQSYEHADKVLEGEIGEQWLADMSNHNIKGLAWLEAGFRHFNCATKPIDKVSDLNGLKLRVMEHQMHVDGWKVMGVDAITTSWGDAMTGMQQGTMDAIEVPWSIFYANGAYDVCKNVSETYHLYTAHALIMSENAWAKVAEEDRDEFIAIAKEAAKFSKQYNRDQENYFKEQCEAKGVEIRSVDLAEWQAKGQEVIDSYMDKYAEEIKAIQALA